MVETNEESKPRITSYGSDGEMTISGISMEDQEKVMACLQAGAYWIRVRDGLLEIVPSWEKLPDPVGDEEMLPFWRKQSEVGPVQYELFGHTGIEYNSFPSFTIQSLCGYYYSPEHYQEQAEKLKSWGFECLRSQRGNNGKFYEIWYLPGLFAAKGDLEEAIGSLMDSKATKRAISFLSRNASFGTLDVSVQRLAQVID